MLFVFSVQNEIIKNRTSQQYFEGVARTEVGKIRFSKRIL